VVVDAVNNYQVNGGYRKETLSPHAIAEGSSGVEVIQIYE